MSDVIRGCVGRAQPLAQQSLPLPPPTASWGGARKGAGRPRIKDRRASEHHKTRPPIKASEPCHVISRIAQGVGSMRRRHMYAALREATIVATQYADTFRIIHLSIQGTHLHLIVEAQSRRALARGMKAFLISAAKHIKRAYREKTGRKLDGPVFTDRYHLKILRAPRQVRHTLSYVLNNWRRHEEDRFGRARTWQIDPYSTAWAFDGWREDDIVWPYAKPPSIETSMITWLPRSWLLRVGWRRHGLISTYEVPGN